MAVGGEAIGGATVSRESSLMHGGRRQRLRPVQCTAAI